MYSPSIPQNFLNGYVLEKETKLASGASRGPATVEGSDMQVVMDIKILFILVGAVLKRTR